MAQRYVRVQSQEGKIYYGLLQLSQNVEVLDAPPWLHGKPMDLTLEANCYTILAPCAPTKIVAVAGIMLIMQRKWEHPYPLNHLYF